ncbi:MAG: hypothetical protein ACAH65_01920 [Chloroflexota bacterium]
MNAEFNWWLLIVGLVVGAGLVWLVVLESRRREADVDASERTREAAWLAVTLGDEGYEVSPEAADRLLELHRRYLEAPPPDPVPAADPDVAEPAVATDQPPTPAEPSELADDDRVPVEGGRVDLGQ